MQFTRLRLSGFKSFVEASELHIEPGLTGIVGPNGCGKSNLVEALGWVMGEGSAKQMRGQGMDDVIFNGSAGRPARNMAEVALVVDNSSRTAPAQFNDADDLEIIRRIEREVGSIYRINGRDTRARDVQTFFADASSGPRSTSIVRQGRIGALIGAKPKERRAILEEAAGISGLHARRHEAELRLRAAEANLTRLNDVMAQIDAQLTALKRQARQASRYRNLSENIRQGEALIFHLRWLETLRAIEDAANMLAAAGRRADGAASAAAASSTAQAQAAEAVPPLRQNEVEAAAALHRLSVARDSLDAEAQRIQEQTARGEQSLTQLTQDQTREAAQLSDSVNALELLAAERVELEIAQTSARDRGDGLRAEAEAAKSELETSEASLDAAVRKLAGLVAARESHTREAAQNQHRLQRLMEQLSDVTREHGQLLAEMPDTVQVEGIAQQAVDARTAVRAAREALSAAENHSEAAQNAEAAAREIYQAAQSESDKLSAEETTLSGLLGSRDTDLWPLLVDTLQVEPGYESALGAALGDDLDYPCDEAAPVHWAMLQGEAPLPPLPEGAQSLDHFVKGVPALRRRLSQIGVVDSADGVLLRAKLLPGQRLVTRAGALWRWDGFTAAADAQTASAKRLEMRNRLSEVTTRRSEAGRKASALRANFEEAANNAAAARLGASDYRNYLRQKEEALAHALDEQGKAEKEILNRNARLGALAEAQIRLQGELEEARRQQQEAVLRLEALESEDQPRMEVAELRTGVEASRAALSQAHGALDSFARDASARAARLEAIARDESAWESRRQAAERQAEILLTRAAQLAEELDGLRAQPAAIAQRMDALLDEISAASARRDHAADALAQAETELASCDKAAKNAQNLLAETREEWARQDEAHNAVQSRAEDLAAQILERLNCAPEDALALANLQTDAMIPDIDTVERDLARHRRERENMGAVNLRAEEEARELRERLDGMTREHGDLEAAIARLRQAIGSLNREGRERLLAAFTTVSEHFSRLFTHLFGGGSAHLEMIESDDPLEAGLEILASPPGKKLQTMTLLSGGEQALTAMALIFAVFLTNPSPICVLDEVDAPLDDANVERFCNLLDEMNRQTKTRFLVITHNGVTMSRMDRLFGVTMAERGVSQLVSVDLERAERLRAVG